MIKGTSVPVVGNGISLGLTDGTKGNGLTSDGSVTQYPNGLVSNLGAYGSNVGSTISGGVTLTNGKVVGVTTDATKSGIIADTSNFQNMLYCIKY